MCRCLGEAAYSESVVWEVRHDEDNVVSVPDTGQQRNDVISATADGQAGKDRGRTAAERGREGWREG